MDALFDLVCNANFDGNATLRKQIFEAFHWFSRFWNAYLDFCDWWGFENFDIADFQIVNRRDSLAESAYIAYSRRLAPLTAGGYMFDFYIDFIEKKLRYPFTVYADYHICRFMIRTGFDAQDVLKGYRKYIKEKFSKMWTWITLSYLYEPDSIEYQACELFAAECEGTVLPEDSSEINYRKICHDMFANIADPDNNFWMYVKDKLLEMKTSGRWKNREERKEKKNKQTPI